MVSGPTGNHGETVLSRVVVAANHDQERVPTLHHPMVEKIVLEMPPKHEFVMTTLAQVGMFGY